VVVVMMAMGMRMVVMMVMVVVVRVVVAVFMGMPMMVVALYTPFNSHGGGQDPNPAFFTSTSASSAHNVIFLS
jgi:hypothetical protein